MIFLSLAAVEMCFMFIYVYSLGYFKIESILQVFQNWEPLLILSFDIVLAADIFVVFSISFPTVDPPQ